MGHVVERAVAELARRQSGVVTMAQCVRLGLTADQVQHRCRTGAWRAVHRGVYVVGAAELPPRGRYLAAVLASGPDAVLSHRSAASHWGLQPFHAGTVHTTAGIRRYTRPGVEVHWTRRWAQDQRTSRHGVPITTLTRTLIDLAEVGTRDEVETAVRAAERLHDLDRSRLVPIHGRHGTPRLIPPADFKRGHLEPLLSPVLRRHDLPEPEYNRRWRGFELDAVWWDAAVVLEIDDWETHRHRDAFIRDRRRSRTVQAAGYRAIQATYEDLTIEADRFAAELRVLGVGRP